MRRPKPYLKKSHRAWYVNFNGRPQRLASEAEGEERAWSEYDKLMAGRQPVRKDYTVAELFDRFLEYHHQKVVAGKGSQETYNFYCVPLNSFIDHIGKMFRTAQLKPYHVEDWCGQKGSDTTRHNKMRTIRAALRWAQRQGYIAESPIQGMTLPTPTPRDTYLTADQWQKLVALVAKSHDKGCLLDVLVTLRETGCRPQEVRKVEARHFDREHRCLVLDRSESKGKKRRRIIHLTDRALEIVDRLAKKHPEGILYRNSKGNAWSHNALDYRCLRLARKLGFPVCPYMIRHSFATHAIAKEVDLKTLAELMGHKDLRMLSEVYAHVSQLDDHMKAALRKATS